MITMFNRREVCVTCSMREQARVREALSAAGIQYTFSTAGNQHRQVTHRAVGFPPTGKRQIPETEYKIFVKKQDYERAVGAIAEVK